MLCQGKYLLQKLLGRGSFGITYLGTDQRLGRQTAIKEFFLAGAVRRNGAVVPPPTPGQAEYRLALQRFEQEAQVLARFKHPSIVAVHDVFRENDTAYMVMEYLAGSTLGTVLEQRGKALGETELVALARPLTEALELIHAADLLHRDIKPDNIMLVSGSGATRPVFIDFGAARDFGGGQTLRQSVVLTPGYAPLEQYAEQARRGPPTDVYALAATLYHLATGLQPPAATDRINGILLKSPRTLNPLLSESFSQALMHALEIKIDTRPASAGAFFTELSSTPAPPPVPPARKLLRGWLALAAGTLVVAVLMVTQATNRPTPQPTPTLGLTAVQAAGQPATVQAAAPPTTMQPAPSAATEASQSTTFLATALTTLVPTVVPTPGPAEPGTPARERTAAATPKTEELSSATPVVEATPSLDDLPGLGTLWVAGTDGIGVFLRRSPREDDKLPPALPEGSQFQRLGIPSVLNGETWTPVRSADDRVGYVPTRYLSGEAPTPTPVPTPRPTLTATIRPTATLRITVTATSKASTAPSAASRQILERDYVSAAYVADYPMAAAEARAPSLSDEQLRSGAARYGTEADYINHAYVADYTRDWSDQQARSMSDAQIKAAIPRLSLEADYINHAFVAGIPRSTADTQARSMSDAQLRLAASR